MNHNEQNNHMIRSLVTAERAAVDLVAQGFTVLDIHIGLRNPTVKILPSPKCSRLQGVVRMIRYRAGGREHTMTCIHNGAQVEWRAPA